MNTSFNDSSTDTKNVNSFGDTSLIEVEYDDITKKKIIIENWIKMLFNRGWLVGDLNEYIETAKNKLNLRGMKNK